MNGELFPDLAPSNVLAFRGHTVYLDVVLALTAKMPGERLGLTITFTRSAYVSLLADMIAMKAWPEDVARTSICGVPFVVQR